MSQVPLFVTHIAHCRLDYNPPPPFLHIYLQHLHTIFLYRLSPFLSRFFE